MLRIAVHSHKGGPGKSTIASSLAVCLCLAGKRVGIVDLDLAGPGLHVIFGLSKKDLKYTLSDALQKKCTPQQAAIDLTNKLGLKRGKLVFVPGAYKTENIVDLLQNGFELATLRKLFREVQIAYSLDYLIIDSRPGIDESTMLAIGLSDLILLILRLDKQDVFGTAVTLDVARVFKKPVLLIVNQIPFDIRNANVEKNLTSTFHIPVVAQLPYYPEVHRNLSSDVFVLKYEDHEFSSKMKSLASSILEFKNKPGETLKTMAKQSAQVSRKVIRPK